MILVERLENITKAIDLEIEYKYEGSYSIIKGFVSLDGNGKSRLFDKELKSTWLNEYLVDDSIDRSELGLNSCAVFHESILFSDPIENFDVYFKSKTGIKKFNL